MENHQAIHNPARTTALEKIPVAAHRMGVSISQAYREIKSGRLGPLVKLGERASAVPTSSTDEWIAARIAEATRLADQKGGRP